MVGEDGIGWVIDDRVGWVRFVVVDGYGGFVVVVVVVLFWVFCYG